MCGHSHTGPFKDLGMRVLVSVIRQMISDGKPIRAVACASSGTHFKVGYHNRALEEVAASQAKPPLELAADVRAVKEQIARELERP